MAIRQAWQENIKPVVVLNKIDRLILEMKLAPLDAYVHMTQVLEKVISCLCNSYSRGYVNWICVLKLHGYIGYV